MATDAGGVVHSPEHVLDQPKQGFVDTDDRLGHEPQPAIRECNDLASRHGCDLRGLLPLSDSKDDCELIDLRVD